MKKHLLSWQIICCFVLSIHINAQTSSADTCRVGIYFSNIYDFDLIHKSFTIEFWTWANYKNDSISPLENMEITNAKDYTHSLSAINRSNPNLLYGNQKTKAIVLKDWDLRYFPFDVQEFKVKIESGNEYIGDMIYVLDPSPSSYDTSIYFDEWEVLGFKAHCDTSRYNTAYGDPEYTLSYTEFGRFTSSLWLKRNGWGTFLKLFLGLYISFGIAILIFSLPYDSGDRFSILVGSLFAAIGNKYIVDSFIPVTNTYTLVDKIYHFSFFELLLFFISTILIVQSARSQNIIRAKRINRLVFVLGTAAFIAVNVMLISQAIILSNAAIPSDFK